MRGFRRNGGMRVKSCEDFSPMMVYGSVATTGCPPPPHPSAIPLDLHNIIIIIIIIIKSFSSLWLIDATMKRFQALQSPAKPLASFYDLLVLLI